MLLLAAEFAGVCCHMFDTGFAEAAVGTVVYSVVGDRVQVIVTAIVYLQAQESNKHPLIAWSLVSHLPSKWLACCFCYSCIAK